MHLLGLIAAAIVAAGCGHADERRAGRTASPAPGPRERPETPVAELVGQAIVLSFEGPEVPPYVKRALREGRAAGVILFRDNVVSAQQLRRLTATLQRAAHGSALVMTDQEGGPVRIVPFAAPTVGQAGQATPAQARSQAAAAARDLRGLGVNVNLAPVADVPSGAGAEIAGRAFGDEPASVAARVDAAVRAYDAGRVGATAKHFPGFGAATINTDDGPVTVRAFEDSDLEPFRAAIRAGVPLVMASHALYPQLDPARIASQSPVILHDLLRGRLGFDGVVVTDSMEAAAVLRRSPLPQAAERAIMAGADLVLLTGNGSFRPVSRHLVAAARRDPALRRRLAEANARVRELRHRLRLAAGPGR